MRIQPVQNQTTHHVENKKRKQKTESPNAVTDVKPVHPLKGKVIDIYA